MQFYKIHPDPITNAEILPLYAIVNVNIREGWQIMSDIGHLFGITWEGQNKPYSIWHAETRRFWRSSKHFTKFVLHYSACLAKYNAIKPNNSWDKKFKNFLTQKITIKINNAITEANIHNEYDQMIFKLLKQKAEHLTTKEINNLTMLIKQ